MLGAGCSIDYDPCSGILSADDAVAGRTALVFALLATARVRSSQLYLSFGSSDLESIQLIDPRLQRSNR